MAREKGELGISAAFEPQSAKPLDCRMIVPTYAELILTTTWTANDGNIYAYIGMLVNVHSDSDASKNGVYKLNALPYSTASNWELVGNSNTAGAGLTKTGTVFSLGGQMPAVATVDGLKIQGTQPDNFFKIVESFSEGSTTGEDIGLVLNSIFGGYSFVLQANLYGYIVGGGKGVDIVSQTLSPISYSDSGIGIYDSPVALIDSFNTSKGSTRLMFFQNTTDADGLPVPEIHTVLLRSTDPSFKGLQYAFDHSANYTDRSIPDVGYLLSKIATLQAELDEIRTLAYAGL